MPNRGTTGRCRHAPRPRSDPQRGLDRQRGRRTDRATTSTRKGKPVNVQQAKTCLRLLTGYWPHPELTEDEVRVWMRQLAQCEDHRLAATVIDTMAESAQFRPNAGQFMSIYRARVPRCAERRPSSALESSSYDREPDDRRMAGTSQGADIKHERADHQVASRSWEGCNDKHPRNGRARARPQPRHPRAPRGT